MRCAHHVKLCDHTTPPRDKDDEKGVQKTWTKKKNEVNEKRNHTSKKNCDDGKLKLKSLLFLYVHLTNCENGGEGGGKKWRWTRWWMERRMWNMRYESLSFLHPHRMKLNDDSHDVDMMTSSFSYFHHQLLPACPMSPFKRERIKLQLFPNVQKCS